MEVFMLGFMMIFPNKVCLVIFVIIVIIFINMSIVIELLFISTLLSILWLSFFGFNHISLTIILVL